MVRTHVPAQTSDGSSGSAPSSPEISGNIDLKAFEYGPRRALEWVHLLDAYDQSTRSNPTRPAVICGDCALDYATLDARSNQLAHHLIGLGVQRNDIVAVLLPRGVDLIVAILAIMKAGGAYMPLDPRNPMSRNEAIAGNAKVRIAVSNDAYCKAIPHHVTRCLVDIDAATIENMPTERLERSYDGGDLAYVINTSGSTGEPKSAAVYHRGFANLLQWYGRALGVEADDAVAIIGAATFDATQKNLFAPLVAGGRLIFPEGDLFDPEQLADLIRRHKVSWVNGTPSNFYPIAEGPGTRSADALASLRWVVLGGESIQPQRLTHWLAQPETKARILNSYGPTECTDICAAWAFDAESNTPPIPIGRPIDNVGIAVLDENGAATLPGEEGELWISGAGIGAGYLGRSDLNARSFLSLPGQNPTERVYRTGDRVRRRSDGAIDFLGRIDTQVKLRGLRIELGEIEAALGTLPEIREAVVLVRDDGSWEAQLVAYLLGKPTAERPSPIALRKALLQKLPDYFVPSMFVWMEAFPYSINGKVDRRALPPPPAPAETGELHTMPAAERDDIVVLLGEVWGKILQRRNVGLDENFFDAGGSSLGLVEIQSELSRRLARKVPIVLLFANPTIRSAAAALSGHNAASVGSSGRKSDRAALMREKFDRARTRRKAG